MNNKSRLRLFFLKVKALFKLVSFIFCEWNKIKKARVIFFFPYYHTGGAEKVHLNIVKAVSDHKNYIFFTDTSYSDGFKKSFCSYADVYEVYEFLNRNYAIRKIFTKILISRINASTNLISVLGCHSGFYYEILPHLKNTVKKYDLIHAFVKPDKGGIEIFSLPYVKYLDQRIVIDIKGKQDLESLYNLEGITPEFNKRVQIISNGLETLENCTKTNDSNVFCVGFVGRWAKEKRPELYIAIANKIKQIYPKIQFVIAGPNFQENEQAISDAGIINLGEIKDQNILQEWYGKMNVILITSYREGFPMVIMESMMYGVIPVSTNVGSINDHITDNFNGFLIENESSFEEIKNKFIEKIIYLYKNNEEQLIISHNAREYALNNFGIENFIKKYRLLLLD
jgi:glycosyltransferase involved in cell wall biosynthesis